VETIVNEFWKEFGRNYYCRYDYESCETEGATKCWNHILSQTLIYVTINLIQKDNPDITADVY
jgi:phosphoglucomutase